MDSVYVYSLLGLVGRLGNQLWQVAATLQKAARDELSRVAFPSDWEYRSLVNLPDSWYDPPRAGERIVDVARDSEGPYFQALEHIEEVAHLLPKLFGPSALGIGRLLDHHRDMLQRITVSECHFTAIHVRRTDYLENPDRFPQMTPKYWHAATNAVLAEHPDTLFLVFSDDIPWCKQHSYDLNVTGRAEYIEGHVRPIPPRARIGEPADIYDLWLMKHCHAHIICNSTYSWWGAFLSEQRQVFYPDVWYGPDAQHSEKMWNAFPAHWKQLPC